MEQWKIDRINELAHKAKEEGHSDEELVERRKLRLEYIRAVVGNVQTQLDNVYLVDEEGHEEKLQKKPEYREEEKK